MLYAHHFPDYIIWLPFYAHLFANFDVQLFKLRAFYKGRKRLIRIAASFLQIYSHALNTTFTKF